MVLHFLQSGHARQRMENFLTACPSALPEVQALRGVTQGADHHPEGDAFEHTMRVISHLPAGADSRLCLGKRHGVNGQWVPCK